MRRILYNIRGTVALVLAAGLLVCAPSCRKAVAPEMDSSDFVLVSDVVPSAILEIRYFSTYNFVGDRIDGYLEPVALMTRESAEALARAAASLDSLGYRLKIFDAYRPQTAVNHFIRWAEDVADVRMKPYFYPDVDKSRLFELEFICAKSSHSRGSTVDLTLFDKASGRDVDMGGTFDWFGEKSNPDCPVLPEGAELPSGAGSALADAAAGLSSGAFITVEQAAARRILRDAMLAAGFKPFATEWWHFTLADEPFPDTYFDFPVRSL